MKGFDSNLSQHFQVLFRWSLTKDPGQTIKSRWWCFFTFNCYIPVSWLHIQFHTISILSSLIHRNRGFPASRLAFYRYKLLTSTRNRKKKCFSSRLAFNGCHSNFRGTSCRRRRRTAAPRCHSTPSGSAAIPCRRARCSTWINHRRWPPKTDRLSKPTCISRPNRDRLAAADAFFRSLLITFPQKKHTHTPPPLFVYFISPSTIFFILQIQCSFDCLFSF